MKYMQTGGFQKNPFMRLTLLLTALFLLGLWITNFALYFSKMGLTPDSVVSYYLGSEANYTAPRTYGAMLEITHMHLPMMAIVVLMLTHLLIFAPFKDRTKFIFIGATFGSALLNEGAGWLVRFVDPGFAVVKVLAFLSFQTLLGFCLVSLSAFLIGPMRKKRR